MRILIIDNYDSFTYNLVQLIGGNEHTLIIKRNDKITIEEAVEIEPDKILLSPGPGKPENAGICTELVENFVDKVPILGVCLGMQVIGYIYGAEIVHAPKIFHGKTSKIIHDGKTIFKNVPNNFNAMRYHSLVVSRESIPEELEISAETESGTIMGIRNKKFSLEGIQFHPESVLTPKGKLIIRNWLGEPYRGAD